MRNARYIGVSRFVRTIPCVISYGALTALNLVARLFLLNGGLIPPNMYTQGNVEDPLRLT